MKNTNNNKHRAILLDIAKRAMLERGLFPDFSGEVIAELDKINAPAKMSDEELLNIIKGIIARVGAKSPADMGKVMGVATKELAGKADGKEISAKVKQLLGA